MTKIIEPSALKRIADDKQKAIASVELNRLEESMILAAEAGFYFIKDYSFCNKDETAKRFIKDKLISLGYKVTEKESRDLKPSDKPVLIISWYHDIPAKKPYNPDSLEGCC